MLWLNLGERNALRLTPSNVAARKAFVLTSARRQTMLLLLLMLLLMMMMMTIIGLKRSVMMSKVQVLSLDPAPTTTKNRK